MKRSLFIFLALVGSLAGVFGEETRSLTARWVLDVIAVEGNPLNDLNALQKVKYIMKAGRPVDRNTL